MRIIKTLKRALTLYYLLAATLPLTLFFFVVLHYANDYLLRDVLKTNANLVRELHNQTNTFLLQRQNLLNHLRDNLFRERLVSGALVDRYIQGELEQSDNFDAIFVVDRSGRVLHFAGRGSDAAQRADIHAIDLSGHELYRRFARQAEPGWSDTHVSLIDGAPSISLGVVAGDRLLIGTIGLEHVSTLINSFSLWGGLKDNLQRPDNEVNFALVDRRGVVIAHSDPEKARRRESLRSYARIAAALAGGSAPTIEQHVGQLLVETAELIPETGWVVWVARDINAAMAPLAKVRILFFVIFIAAVLLAAASVLVTARNLMKPLRWLLDDVRSLAAGNHQLRPLQRSYHEIDELSDSFRGMATAVQIREVALRSGEQRFRSLVNSVEGMVFEATLPGLQMTFVSERVEAMTGFAPELWLKDPAFWSQCLHPDDRQWAVEYRKQQSHSGQSFQFEYRLQHRDRSILWLREMASVVAEGDGPARLFGVAIDITASKEAELALQESEQRFRSLVEQAADAIFIHDLRGQLLDVNEQACRSLGYSRGELKTLRMSDIEQLQPPLQFDSLWNAVQGSGSLTFEAEHLRKDGSRFPVEVRLGAFQNQDRPMLLALARDITERRRSLFALRESEERYRSVVSAMTEAVLLTDNNGIIVASNPSSERILGLTTADMQSRKLSDIMPRLIDEAGVVLVPGQQPETQTRQTGKPVRHAVFSPDFTNRPQVWLEINTQPIFSFGETGVAGVVTILTDITERKEATATLQQSEERVRLLLNSSAEGLYGIDLQGCCTFCNPAALRMLGYEWERELLGRDMHSLIHARHADRSAYPVSDCPVCQVISGNMVIHCDSEVFWRADDSSFEVEYWAHPISKGGETVGVVVTFHDITERKRMQQLTVRNAQLASLGELAAGVAHEINNPISGVINYAQILLNRAHKQGGETDLVERIIHEGERIATIVRDMLFFAREGGGERHIARFADLLQDAISLTAAQIRKEGIVLKLEIAEDLPSIQVRAQQIQQLFLNLLSNARHALKEKYPGSDPDKVIIISARIVQAADGPLVSIMVEDHGIGIPEKILPRIMNPFVTTKPAGVGTGLGLSISYEIVKQHGGEIRIESLEGEMTRVIVELPVAKGISI